VELDAGRMGAVGLGGTRAGWEKAPLSVLPGAAKSRYIGAPEQTPMIAIRCLRRSKLAATLLGCTIALSATAGHAAAQSAQSTDIVVDTTIPAAAQPRPGVGIDPVAATRAYLARVPAEQRARSDAYFEGGYWIGLWDTLLSAGVMLMLLGLGWSRRMRDRAERATRGVNRQTLLYALTFILLTAAILLPWSLYTGFIRERQYDLMNQSLGAWLVDFLKAIGLNLVFMGAAITGFYAIVRRIPRSWPLWAAAAGIVFIAFTNLVYPVYVAPMFNTFTPVTDERVREPVLRMARANQVAVDQVYVFDQSRQTKRISAHVAGLFNTRRIALNDNLLERTSLPEIEAVMGHEIGHHVLNHAYEGLFMTLILLVAGFLVLRWAFEWSAARWGERWGVRGIGDVAGLPLLALLLTLIGFAAAPLTRNIIRSNEAEADAFGLNAARQPDGFARVALRLGEYRKLDPTPLEEWLFYTHPSGRNRIYRAMVWKAAHAGTGGSAEQAETGDPPATN
jgi:STE24 endopeptidase